MKLWTSTCKQMLRGRDEFSSFVPSPTRVYFLQYRCLSTLLCMNRPESWIIKRTKAGRKQAASSRDRIEPILTSFRVSAGRPNEGLGS
jgi:hypothetical protein